MIMCRTAKEALQIPSQDICPPAALCACVTTQISVRMHHCTNCCAHMSLYNHFAHASLYKSLCAYVTVQTTVRIYHYMDKLCAYITVQITVCIRHCTNHCAHTSLYQRMSAYVTVLLYKPLCARVTVQT